MTKVLKFCNNCNKPKMVKATHNYANCCGGRAGFRHDAELLEAHEAKKAATSALFAKYAAEWGLDL